MKSRRLITRSPRRRARASPVAHEAKLLRSCQVDYQLELGCLLDRQIARFRTIEDFDDVAGGQTEQVGKVSTLRYQSPKLDEVTRLVHGWKPMFHGSLDDQFALRRREKGTSSDYSGLHLFVRSANRRIDGPGLKIGHLKIFEFESERLRSFRLWSKERHSGAAQIDHAHPDKTGQNLRQVSKVLPVTSMTWVVNPVTLPPGRDRLVTSPLCTGVPDRCLLPSRSE
jgi:hypothetical protein